MKHLRLTSKAMAPAKADGIKVMGMKGMGKGSMLLPGMGKPMV